MSNDNKNQAALVFGASGEQGRAVLGGFVDAGFSPVYGFSSDPDTINDQYLSDALQCILLEGKINDPTDVRKALETTKATVIFLTTTYEMPVSQEATGYQAAQDEEYETIVQWFQTLLDVYKEDKVPRTVIFSTRDNVQELARTKFELTGKDDWIEPMDDGSIVPHYSAKGRGGEEALRMLKDDKNSPDLKLVLLTLPFFYSNFLAFFCPLPNEGRTDWELSGCFGDGETKIDMMSVSDLGTLVVNVYHQADKFDGQILRIASERISMNEIARQFSDLFGKDVVYNPLLPKELAALDFPAAPAMAQMCQFLGDSRELAHDLELTHMLAHPRKLANFETWLLTHSDSTAFSRVGLDRDAEPLSSICVFGALSPQGQSVVKGLLADRRKQYTIRCSTRQNLETTKRVQETIALDPDRISFVQADFDDIKSCQRAVKGMDGAFLVADLHENPNTGGTGDQQQDAKQKEYLESEERHVKNIIDACEGNVRHLIFSTMESSEKVNKDLPEKDLLEFSPKARAAAYARSKNLSVTFVLTPCYSEVFLDMMNIRKDEVTGKDTLVMQVPGGHDAKIMVMSVEELGPAVANIFDSYEVYAGHEIGLVTDFVTTHEVKSVLQEVFSGELNVETEDVEMSDCVEARDTYMRDLGQLFSGLSHSKAVASRHSIAKTYQLVPNVRSLRRWVEHNRDNPSFREKLGLR